MQRAETLPSFHRLLGTVILGLALSGPCWAEGSEGFDLQAHNQHNEEFVNSVHRQFALAEKVAGPILKLSQKQIDEIPQEQMNEIVRDLVYLIGWKPGQIPGARALGHLGPRAKCAVPHLRHELKLVEEEQRLLLFTTGVWPDDSFREAIQKIDPAVLRSVDENPDFPFGFSNEYPECRQG